MIWSIVEIQESGVVVAVRQYRGEFQDQILAADTCRLLDALYPDARHRIARVFPAPARKAVSITLAVCARLGGRKVQNRSAPRPALPAALARKPASMLVCRTFARRMDVVDCLTRQARALVRIDPDVPPVERELILDCRATCSDCEQGKQVAA